MPFRGRTEASGPGDAMSAPPSPRMQGLPLPPRRRSPYRLEFDLPPGDLWVFGYGSLMWEPGFAHLDEFPAMLYGYHRAFCILSHFYRGTPERPGIVLGLDSGGACRGRVFRVAAAEAAEAVQYLFDREMVSGVYRPTLCHVYPDRREPVEALTFVANHAHEHYVGHVPPETVADFILRGHGARGPCRDYLENTVRQLEALGIQDGPAHHMLDLVAARLKA